MITKSLSLSFLILFFTSSVWAENHLVEMKSISFNPKYLKVKTGDTVEWTNVSYTDHSATSEIKNEFDTGRIEPKKMSKKITFSKEGNYEYHCSVHGKTMSGQIEVIKK